MTRQAEPLFVARVEHSLEMGGWLLSCDAFPGLYTHCMHYADVPQAAHQLVVDGIERQCRSGAPIQLPMTSHGVQPVALSSREIVEISNRSCPHASPAIQRAAATANRACDDPAAS